MSSSSFLLCNILLNLAVWKSQALVAVCPDIGSIKYADVIPSRDPPFTLGTVLKIKCDKGYKGHGVPKLKCQKDGTWSDRQPFCAAFKCERDESKLEKGRKCPRACKEDIDCGQFKKCDCDDRCGLSCINSASKCKPLSPPENGYIEGTVLSYGYRVRYRCNDGFLLSGPAARKCRSDKKWSGRAPKCLPFGSCGMSSLIDERDISGKVVEGKNAKEGAWPWQAVLFHNARHSVPWFYDRHMAFGGGTIIDDKWILTAAHVFDNILVEKAVNWRLKFLVVIGMTKYPEPEEDIPDHVRVLEPENVYRHLSYDSITFDYDVALIRVGKHLKRDGMKFAVDEKAQHGVLKFSRHVKPICLPCMNINPRNPAPEILTNYDERKCNKEIRSPSLTIAGTQVVVTGFGWSRKSGEKDLIRPKTMQEGTLKIESDDICSESVRLNSDDGRYTDRMLCTGSANETLHTDACDGDSGGPIVKQVKTDERTKHWVQVGIVSWGFTKVECGKAPGFYVNLPTVMPWLWKVISEEDIRCDPPIEINDGKIEVNGTKVGSVAQYSCNQGYFMNGPPQRICQLDKKWSDQAPLCVKKDDCEKPILQFGTVKSPHPLTLGSSITFSCNKGYQRRGPLSATCGTKGLSAEPPKCINRDAPEMSTKSSRGIVGTAPTSMPRIGNPCSGYPCNGGTCSLSDTDPEGFVCFCRTGNLGKRCEIRNICHLDRLSGSIKVLKNGSELGRSTAIAQGDELSIECAKSRKHPLRSHKITCLGDDRWSRSPKILCAYTESSCTLDEVDSIFKVYVSGNELIDSFPFTIATGDSIITFECESDDGTERFENVCMDGKWQSGIPKRCAAVTCPAVPKPKNGAMSGAQIPFQPGDRLSFSCENYYQLNGASVITCRIDGSWSSAVPTCSELGCFLFYLDLNRGVFIKDHEEDVLARVGESYLLKCKNSKRQTKVTCLGKDVWEPDVFNFICPQ